MVNLEYILFICVVAPLLLMLLLLQGRPRLLMRFMIIGIIVCLFASEFNTILLNLFGGDMTYLTTVITPASEEILKTIPVLFYAKVFSDKRDSVLLVALSLGIGFGMFENTVILVQNIDKVTMIWAILRGFATALMHGICTVMVGLGICFINKRRKLFFTGIFALLTFASIYHGIYNMLQLDYKYIGASIPIITYIPILIRQLMYYRKREEENRLRNS